MLDDIRDVAEFYNSNPDGEQGRLEQHLDAHNGHTM
jgi:hypothetical protein